MNCDVGFEGKRKEGRWDFLLLAMVVLGFFLQSLRHARPIRGWEFIVVVVLTFGFKIHIQDLPQR